MSVGCDVLEDGLLAGLKCTVFGPGFPQSVTCADICNAWFVVPLCDFRPAWWRSTWSGSWGWSQLWGSGTTRCRNSTCSCTAKTCSTCSCTPARTHTVSNSTEIHTRVDRTRRWLPANSITVITIVFRKEPYSPAYLTTFIWIKHKWVNSKQQNRLNVWQRIMCLCQP